MDFQILQPRKIVFQKGISSKVGEYVRPFGGNVLLLSGRSSLKKTGSYDKILNSLISNGLKVTEYQGISFEPDPRLIDDIVGVAQSENINVVVSVGGGSVIDAGKSAAGLLVNDKGVENYLEGVGLDWKLKNDPLPFVAVPTTAGSGAEATKNAVITSREKKYKKSFRDDRLLARVVLADPELTLTLSENETFFGGMDALSQLIESFVSKKRNGYCSALAAYYIPKAVAALKKLKTNPADYESRSVMLEAATASGITLSNSGLGAIHGFASGMGGMFDIPHGLICAVLLPHVIKANSAKDQNIYKEAAGLMKRDNSEGDIDEFIDMLFELNDYLGIPLDFGKYNINKELSKEIVERSRGSSMNGNPVDYDDGELRDFISKLL